MSSRGGSAGDIFLESCCDESSSTATSALTYTGSDYEEQLFYFPGRPRVGGWRCRTRKCLSPIDDVPLATEMAVAPQTLARPAPLANEGQNKPKSVVPTKPLMSFVPLVQVASHPSPSASENSVMGLYSFLTSPFTVDATAGRAFDRSLAPAWVADFSGLMPTAPPSQNISTDFTALPLQALRRTVYTASATNFSVGDLSVLVDDHHKVRQTTKVITIKRNGQRLINDYVVHAELGRGSYGKVKLVTHIPSQKLFAMKILELYSGSKHTAMIRAKSMRREVAVMKRICHPHMVKLHEVLADRRKGRLYMVMDYISGGSIAKKITDWTIEPIPEPRLRIQARQLLSALKYMQLNNVVHRDIKPDNILVDEQGNAYLADFGTSAICTEEGVAGVEGTPAFMPPEICRGEAAVCGTLVDIWALGASLYQLMYGVLPFTAPTQLKLTQAILNDPLTFPDDDVSDHPGAADVPVASAEFKVLLRGMLEKDPKKRWNVRTALQCKWLEPYQHPDVPPQLRVFSEHSRPLLDITYPESSLMDKNFAAEELEEAIASLSISEIEM